jgi:peptide-methionine (S)-S-oxide reductase
MPTETAIFAAGCFWGVQHYFDQLPGVLASEVGYTGGSLANPSYHQVCQGASGHAEALKITFDPQQITYEALLEHFFKCHNPCTLNRQGPDVGHQYRSAIFYLNPAQQESAEAVRDQLEASQAVPGKIVTEIVPASIFYRAEAYHQKYFAKHGKGSCHI